MSTQTITKKRKSADGTVSAAKKVKVAKSADKPAPVKSALKKQDVETVKAKTKSKTKPVIEAHEMKESQPVQKPSKPAKKAKKAVIEEEDDDDKDGGTTLTADQTASLLAGFSSESEDDGGEEDGEGIPTSKLPKAPTTGEIQDRIASATKALKKSGSRDDDPERTPGVIYIGRIPHGFHEPQMKAYFSQFGTITHLKLARNRKTGKSKHFAFLEFASSVVADIVAKTMDKYLLFGHILQVRKVPAEQVGEGMWVGEGRKGWNVRPNNKLEGGGLRRGKTREDWTKRIGREERKREVKREKLKGLGYEFEMPALKGVDAVAVKGKEAEDVGAGAEAAIAEDVVETEQTVAPEDGGTVAVEKRSKTKRPAEGKPKVKEAKKAVKKVKT